MTTATISVRPRAQASARQGPSYRPDIDGLRAIAIISVVAFHARVAFFGGGFIGVDVFFVISGYLIGSLVYRDVSNSRFSLVHFYERRVKRILPAMIAVVFVCNAIAFVLLSPLELKKYCAESFSAVFSASNIYYWRQPSYFNSGSIFRPMLMTWSLGIEEQFYLLFPLALFVLHRFARRRVSLWVALVCGISLACSAVCVHYYPSAAFYLLPTRAWELGLGVLIAIYEVQRQGPAYLGAATSNILGWFGLGMIVASVVAYTEGTSFPGLAAVLPTVGAACLINARNSFVNRRLLASRPMVYVGLISYSWYLWHWPLMSFARIVSGGLLSVPRTVLIGVLSLGLAALSHRFIEQPFRKAVLPPPRLFASYATLLILLGTASFIGYKQQGWPGRTPQIAKLEVSVHELARNRCLASLDASAPRLTAPCIVDSGGPKLALLGDSHAAALGTTLQNVALQHGYGFELLTKAACPPLSMATLRLAARPTFEQTCDAFNRAVLKHVLNDPKISVIVLAGFWSAPWSESSGRDFYSDSSQPGKEVSEAESYCNLHSGLLKAIALLRASGKRVFVVTDVPRFDPDPMDSVRNSVMKGRGALAALLSSHVFSLDAVSEDSLIQPPDTITDGEVRRAALEGGAQIIDPTQNLCPASRCQFWDNGLLLYSDSNHLTPAGAEYALKGQDPISNTN